MYLMNNLLKLLGLFFILLTYSGCGPSFPKENIAEIRYKTKVDSEYMIEKSLCVQNDNFTLKYMENRASLNILHSYLKSRNSDIYSDVELSASVELVEVTKMRKTSNNCFDIEGKISKDFQRQLSIIELDIPYYKIKPDKSMISNGYYSSKYDKVYAYIIAMNQVPNLAVVNSAYEKYLVSWYTIGNSKLDKSKHIPSKYSGRYSSKDIKLINRSFIIDPIKVRYFANSINKKEDKLGRVFNNIHLNFIAQDGTKTEYIKYLVRNKYYFGEKLNILKKYNKPLEIEIDYIIRVPKKYNSSRVYLSSVLNKDMFNVYAQENLLLSSSNVYTAEYITDENGEKVIHIKLKSKKKVKPHEYDKYLKELSNIPMKIGEYKRGGMKSMHRAEIYIENKGN